MPRKNSISPRSVISSVFSRFLHRDLISLLFSPKISKSSTYPRTKICRLVCLKITWLATSTKPSCASIDSRCLYHYLGDCFKPYKAFSSL